MKNKTPKDLLKYLQERYKDFLVKEQVDFIVKDKNKFVIGSPTFQDNGTASYEVYPLKNSIEVKEHIWDEKEYDNNGNGIYLDSNVFNDIDDWMEFEGFKASKVKSRPKKNYR